ncbi:hypothetical protein BV20DRAFT_980357 [Pilatotrama ljubarskyi]|nr:hypothetical protein BV20DRAFT_980357 [Pilatotrama ljubarskyi]
MAELTPAIEYRLRTYGDLEPAAVRWLLRKRRMDEMEARRMRNYWIDTLFNAAVLGLSYVLGRRASATFLVVSLLTLVWWMRIGTASFSQFTGRDRNELLRDPVFERRRCYLLTVALSLLYGADALGFLDNHTMTTRLLLLWDSVHVTVSGNPWIVPAVFVALWTVPMFFMERYKDEEDKEELVYDVGEYFGPGPNQSHRVHAPGQ